MSTASAVMLLLVRLAAPVPAIVALLADEFQVSASNGSFMRGREEIGNASPPGLPNSGTRSMSGPRSRWR